jgi:hypothetical protein
LHHQHRPSRCSLQFVLCGFRRHRALHLRHHRGRSSGGLTLNPSTGAVTGTPTYSPAPFNFTVTAYRFHRR